MPRSRFDRLDPTRREQILDVAARAFAESGFDGASYNRILADAELSKSSAYYLFEGKADLYAAVLQRATTGLLAAMPVPEPTTDAPEWWASTRAWLQSSLVFLHTQPQAAALFLGYLDARRRGVVPDLDQQLDEAARGTVEALLASGQAAGAVRTDLPGELLLALTGAVFAALDHHFAASLDEGAIDVYIDTLRRLLTP
ncbi:MAG: TetR/AcrR family transcriptional regulator [Alphaproteobacteria bacterium]|nr:TetR/AcrR family transcriptional regulator [Alphaproteobacteria bacterium]